LGLLLQPTPPTVQLLGEPAAATVPFSRWIAGVAAVLVWLLDVLCSLEAAAGRIGQREEKHRSAALSPCDGVFYSLLLDFSPDQMGYGVHCESLAGLRIEKRFYS
jgi:hypothetical protein